LPVGLFCRTLPAFFISADGIYAIVAAIIIIVLVVARPR
jgi:hypothetical protein